MHLQYVCVFCYLVFKVVIRRGSNFSRSDFSIWRELFQYLSSCRRGSTEKWSIATSWINEEKSVGGVDMWCICLYIYINMYVCMYVLTHEVFVSTCICIHMYICMYIFMYSLMCFCTYIHMYLDYLHTCTYIYLSI